MCTWMEIELWTDVSRLNGSGVQKKFSFLTQSWNFVKKGQKLPKKGKKRSELKNFDCQAGRNQSKELADYATAEIAVLKGWPVAFGRKPFVARWRMLATRFGPRRA